MTAERSLGDGTPEGALGGANLACQPLEITHSPNYRAMLVWPLAWSQATIRSQES
jgi:hypothetical protein